MTRDVDMSLTQQTDRKSVENLFLYKNSWVRKSDPGKDMMEVRADTILDFPEEAWIPVDTNPGLPEERTFDSVVLSGRSENT